MEIYIVAIFGLLIGSFLNVCIWRIPRKLSIIHPRSACVCCGTQISSLDNIPVVSWVLLRGKCRTCAEPISGQYPLVEMISTFAALASFIRFGSTPTTLLVYALLASLIVITFIDLEFRIIPNVISFPGMIIGLLLGAAQEYMHLFSPPITQGALDSLVGFFLGGGFFYIVGIAYYAVTKKVGLGGGDIKLLAMTGAILGWRSVPTTIIAGSIAGSIVGIATMLIQGTGRQTEIPFGPWLALGTVIYIFHPLALLTI